MRRTTAAVLGTFAGTALLVGLKLGNGASAQGANASAQGTAAAAGGVQPTVQDTPTGLAVTPAPASPASPTATPRSSPTKRPRPKATTQPSRSAPSGGGSGGSGGSGLKNGTFTGAASSNEYGTIQVTLTVSGGRLTDVRATYPTSPSRTAQINARAIPALRQEALAAQSAQVSAVSGASFTSASYQASLRSALAAAKA